MCFIYIFLPLLIIKETINKNTKKIFEFTFKIKLKLISKYLNVIYFK
jgi:hypothetical protein